MTAYLGRMGCLAHLIEPFQSGAKIDPDKAEPQGIRELQRPFHHRDEIGKGRMIAVSQSRARLTFFVNVGAGFSNRLSLKGRRLHCSAPV